MDEQSLENEVLNDTVVKVPVITYKSWKEPKAYFPYGQGLQQIILQKFGPVIGAMIFFVCLERGRIVAWRNARALNKIAKGNVQVGPVSVEVDQPKQSEAPKPKKPVKRQFTAFVNGELKVFEYVEPPPSWSKRTFKTLVSNGKKAVQVTWKSVDQAMNYLRLKVRSLFNTSGKSFKGAGAVGACLTAVSYINAFSDLVAEVSTGSPTLIWHGVEDCKISLFQGKVPTGPYYISKLTVADLAILCHYSYTGAIGGDLGYSATQLWNSVGSDMSLLPDMTLEIILTPAKKKTYKNQDEIDKQCVSLHEKWIKINNDIVATSATFGNLSGFAPIVVSMFAGKLSSSGKTIRAVFVLMVSHATDDLLNRTTESLEALSE